jgi:D-serine deaminase-like pyridoxal phosphate-dependent protein
MLLDVTCSTLEEAKALAVKAIARLLAGYRVCGARMRARQRHRLDPLTDPYIPGRPGRP